MSNVPEEPFRMGENIPSFLKPDGLCKRCKVRKATDIWIGEAGVLALTHGMRADWCRQCVVVSQLEYCRKSAERIPELEAELERLQQQSSNDGAQP